MPFRFGYYRLDLEDRFKDWLQAQYYLIWSFLREIGVVVPISTIDILSPEC